MRRRRIYNSRLPKAIYNELSDSGKKMLVSELKRKSRLLTKRKKENDLINKISNRVSSNLSKRIYKKPYSTSRRKTYSTRRKKTYRSRRY